ncbi:MAG TPA: 16S rRNA (uracil(1498)-N(3))-methyltransferase [Anaeromyxobacteraceae bacterium]|nr:16S rRNA (uracil(1498)-N(3))-methyltransferase [Anaeromyxobacteraceae bacterium]
MNLVLLDDADLGPDGTARLGGRRAAHVAEVLRKRPGDRLAVGRLGGELGTAEVLALEPGAVTLRVRLDRPPPPPSPVELVLGLPRPKILRRVLQAAAAMGVKRLVLLGSWRVEKSYFASPLLRPEALQAELRLGLEQGRDTLPPQVLVRRFFKPFVEDELDGLCRGARRLLADPAAEAPIEALARGGERAVLAVGPEGGFTRYEVESLLGRGFERFSLGPRPLRVDAAVPCATGQVELWLRGGAPGGRPGVRAPPAR